MPAKILLIPVGLRENDQISSYRSIVSDNVRWSAFFIQMFEDDWGPRDLFRKLFQLAVDCRDDATMPMREVVVYLKDAPRESVPQILAFRKELEEREDLRVFHYSGVDDLRAQLIETCNGWARVIIDSASDSKNDSELGAELGSGAVADS